MRFIALVCILFVSNVFAMESAEKTALIITIDQKRLGDSGDQIKMMPSVMLKSMLQPMMEITGLGEPVKGLISLIGTGSLIENWDNARAEWVKDAAKDAYDGIFIVRGDETRDDIHMAGIWANAMKDYDVVDYVSMVHGGDQLIKKEWGVPENSRKLRLVYSEACRGGNGKDHFVNIYGAQVSVGHTTDTAFTSASPFFTFNFLQQWFAGKSLMTALKYAWFHGTEALNTGHGFMLASLLGNFKDAHEAIDGSRIVYAVRGDIDLNEFSLKTKALTGNDLIEEGEIK